MQKNWCKQTVGKVSLLSLRWWGEETPVETKPTAQSRHRTHSDFRHYPRINCPTNLFPFCFGVISSFPRPTLEGEVNYLLLLPPQIQTISNTDQRPSSPANDQTPRSSLTVTTIWGGLNEQHREYSKTVNNWIPCCFKVIFRWADATFQVPAL